MGSVLSKIRIRDVELHFSRDAISIFLAPIENVDRRVFLYYFHQTKEAHRFEETNFRQIVPFDNAITALSRIHAGSAMSYSVMQRPLTDTLEYRSWWVDDRREASRVAIVRQIGRALRGYISPFRGFPQIFLFVAGTVWLLTSSKSIGFSRKTSADNRAADLSAV